MFSTRKFNTSRSLIFKSGGGGEMVTSGMNSQSLAIELTRELEQLESGILVRSPGQRIWCLLKRLWNPKPAGRQRFRVGAACPNLCSIVVALPGFRLGWVAKRGIITKCLINLVELNRVLVN